MKPLDRLWHDAGGVAKAGRLYHVACMAKRSQFFRAGVGIAVIDDSGKLLVLRRADVDEPTWQLPQGGLDDGETATEAMWRELEEETGLGQNDCELLATTRGWHVYELPADFRSRKIGLGQVQKWFLCRLVGDEAAISPDGKEFDAWRWTTAGELLETVVPFRRALYQAVFEEFDEFLI